MYQSHKTLNGLPNVQRIIRNKYYFLLQQDVLKDFDYIVYREKFKQIKKHFLLKEINVIIHMKSYI